MKKIVVILVVMLFFVSSFALAQYKDGAALGVQGNGGYSTFSGVGGPAISFKIPQLPIMWGVSFGFSTYNFSLGVTADWWFINNNIEDIPLSWYVGAGIFGGAFSSSGYWNMAIGGRVPVGLQFWLFELIDELPNKLEIFIEAAPALGIYFGSQQAGLAFTINGSLGVRWWF
jgi:hypothetical protein